MKKIAFLLIFLTSFLFGFGQTIFPNNWQSNSGSFNYLNLKVRGNFILPASLDTSNKVPGLVRVIGNSFYWVGNDGKWHFNDLRVATATQLGSVLVTGTKGISINPTTGELSSNLLNLPATSVPYMGATAVLGSTDEMVYSSHGLMLVTPDPMTKSAIHLGGDRANISGNFYGMEFQVGSYQGTNEDFTKQYWFYNHDKPYLHMHTDGTLGDLSSYRRYADFNTYILPYYNDSLTIGSLAMRWKKLYANGLNINGADITFPATAGTFVYSVNGVTPNPTTGDVHLDLPSGGSGGITTVSGTANRIAVANGATSPVVDIASTYAGQSSLNTLGTVTTGVWNATPIGDAYIASSAAWSAKQNALGFTPVPDTRTINGQALTANVTLTTANVAASTNKNYVTDAQVTDIGTINGMLVKANNLSDLTNLITARTNLGLGAMALKANVSNTDIVAGVDATKIGAGTTDNTEFGYISGLTSDAQAQINLKAPIASPSLTGTPLSTTPTATDNSTRIATTAHVLTRASQIAHDSISAIPGFYIQNTGANGGQPLGTKRNDSLEIIKTLVAGSGITLTPTGDSLVTVSSTGGGGTGSITSIDVQVDTASTMNDIGSEGGPITSGAGVINIHIPEATTAIRGIINTRGQSFSGTKSFTSGFASASNNQNADFWAMAGQGIYTSDITTSRFQFKGSTTMRGRASFAGSTTGTLGDGNAYASVLVANQPVTTAATGTHPILANMAIKALDVTAGGAAVTDNMNLYVAPPSTSTVTGKNWTAFFDGLTGVVGDLILASKVSNTGATAATSSVVDLSYPANPTGGYGGLLIPTGTAAMKAAITSPADGLLFYQSDGTKGVYLYNGTTSAWGLIGSGSSTLAATSFTTGTTGTDVNWTDNGAGIVSLNIPDAGTTTRGVISGAGQSFAGVKSFTNGIATASSNLNSDLFAMGGQSAYSSDITTSAYLFHGATAVRARVGMRGSTTTTLSVGNSYANLIVGGSPITLAASGTHDIIASQANIAPAITTGGASVNYLLNTYIGPAPTGLTPTTGSYALMVDGNLLVPSTSKIYGTLDAGGTPTTALGIASVVGSTATASIAGNDLRGVLTINVSGTAPSSGGLAVTITPSAALGSSAVAVFSPATSAASNVHFYSVYDVATGTIKLSFNTTAATGTYSYNYIVHK